METKNRSAFTLIEILIVVVIMAVLAATIIPQFTDSSDDAKESTALFNLTTLRGQVELYKAQHAGGLPGDDLAKLTTRTTANGTVSATGEYGPYLPAIPENTISGSRAVKVITGNAPTASDVTADDAGGWIYSSATGGIWLDHSAHFSR